MFVSYPCPVSMSCFLGQHQSINVALYNRRERERERGKYAAKPKILGLAFLLLFVLVSISSELDCFYCVVTDTKDDIIQIKHGK